MSLSSVLEQPSRKRNTMEDLRSDSLSRFLKLPLDLLGVVFSFLAQRILVFAVAPSCKSFYRCSKLAWRHKKRWFIGDPERTSRCYRISFSPRPLFKPGLKCLSKPDNFRLFIKIALSHCSSLQSLGFFLVVCLIREYIRSCVLLCLACCHPRSVLWLVSGNF